MDITNLKLYSVIIGGGSGILFQPLTDKYTYILTARHVFFDETDNGRGIELIKKKSIEVLILNNIDYNPKIYEIEDDENYFPHSNSLIDLAIFKIEFIAGYKNIFIQENSDIQNSLICGFPNDFRHNTTLSEKFTNYEIDRLISDNDSTYRVQLRNTTLSQSNISGMSGGGVLKLNNNHISLIGIQSKVPANASNGQIDFVSVIFFNEIIKGNRTKLEPLLPPYMASFQFLKGKAFNISAVPDDDDISFTRLFLKNMTNQVIKSNITPFFIREYFKERLLLNEKNKPNLNDELIYITWLEFLTIVNIAKAKIYSCDELEELFTSIRLIYKDTDIQWQDIEFLKECLDCNFDGLKEGATVLIKTKLLPTRAKIEHYKLDKDSILPRIDRLKNEFEAGRCGDIYIDNGTGNLKEFAFSKYNFIHFEYLKHFMLVENCSDFKKFNSTNESELLQKLKEEYGKLFSL